MADLDVKNGMSIIGILNLGDDETLYSALTTNTISTTANRMEQVQTLLVQLKDEANTEIQNSLISQITQLMDNETTSLHDRVQSDLTAQDTLLSAEDVNVTIAIDSGLDQRSKLFDVVATPKLKLLAQKLTEAMNSEEP